MAILCRSFFILTLLFASAVRVWAASGAENRAFDAAANEFRDAFFKEAEADFGDFIQKFPTSTRLPEAVLYQAEARIKLADYAGALHLLSAHQSQAGALADWYLLCQGEALLAKGDYKQAEASFSRLIQEFPASPRRLAAVVDAATARMRLSKWPEVIRLLGQTNGVFQLAASTNHASTDVIRGLLLLSEAQLALNDTHAAERSLQFLAASPLDATNNWQRQYLLCRVLLTDGRLDAAMQNTTNLLVLADATGLRGVQAQSVALQAALLERLGRRDDAVAVYQKNLGAGIPAEHQRQALLKITELSLALGKIAEAAQVLQTFLGQFPTNDCSDLALLTLGELRLRQFDPGAFTNQLATPTTNAPATTNLLDQAVAAFQSFRSRFPQSALLGKAQLDLGWCYWLGGRISESQAPFQSAVALLPPSTDQAKALFKLADAQFQLTNYSAAISNYTALVERFADSPEVRTNLSEPALYQIVRASQAAGDLSSATNALARILAWFPNGFYADRAVLLTGQEMGSRYPAMARKLYQDFVQSTTNTPLLPELDLAIARTYEGEAKWDAAIQQYDAWLATFTNHAAQDRAEYFRARASYEAGHETNALMQFTNFIARFPTSEYGPLAQWWVADYYYGNGNWIEAESNYKVVFQNTNWVALPLAFQARMMAGRAAYGRQGWETAQNYFIGLANDQSCPADLRAQALFADGDTFLLQSSTNKLTDYKNAFNAYDLICQNYPTNALAALAWGQKAICLLQFVQGSQDFASITNDFQQVLDSPLADATARSIAEVGLAVTLEKLADSKTDPEKTALLNLSLRHDLRVYNKNFLRDGETPDPFWTRKAGLEAARLAEQRLGMRLQAINIYQELQEQFPELRLSDKIRNLKARSEPASEQN